MFVVRSGSVVNNFSRTSVWFFAFVVACLVAPVTSRAQSASLIGGVHVQHLEQVQKGMAAEARQKKMETDAAKLVEMAQQLKTSVDKTNKDMLSVDVIKEAERIEKLAHEVREGARQ